MLTPIPEEQHTKQMEMEEGEGKMGWKHWGLMLLCCLPMIAIAILIIVGAWGVR
jgi:nitrate reductase NapE component